MDPQALQLTKNAARASVPYAGGLAVAFLLLGLVPVCGGCVNFFLSLGAFAGVAYLLTPKMTYFPAGQTQTMLALYIGLGVAATITAGFVIASIISGLLWMALSTAIGSLNSSNSVFGSAVSGAFGLVIGAFFSLFYGLIIGTGLAFLGSYLAFNRMPNQQNAARPF